MIQNLANNRKKDWSTWRVRSGPLGHELRVRDGDLTLERVLWLLQGLVRQDDVDNLLPSAPGVPGMSLLHAFQPDPEKVPTN